MLEENIEHEISWKQDPGEIQDCHVFKLSNTRHVEVDRLQVTFPEGSHHVHIYRSTEPEADNSYDCFNGIDWSRWSLLLGAQTLPMDWQLPDGVTIPLEPHQQILTQVHWLNTTEAPLDFKIDMSFHTTEYSKEHLGVVFGVNKRINVSPGQHARVQAFCPMPEGAKLHALMGHFHMHGSDYKVSQRMPDQLRGKQIYWAPDEPSFEFKLYNPPHEVATGTGFEYECNFFNWEGHPLLWGSDTKTQEHCNMTAYFSPAEKISDLCLNVPSKLEALRPTRDTIRAGTTVTLDVDLAEPMKTDVTIVLKSSDQAALEVPATLKIPAGERKSFFVAKALRPGNFEVSATMDDAKVVAGIRVTGVVVSEVFYNPNSSANQLQWIELANLADVPVDLSRYSVGAGANDFMATLLPLAGTIKARGCIVVGGPVSSFTNGFPYFAPALDKDLNPDLGLGIDQAAGVGVFISEGMSPTARPVDAVVYGTGGVNRSLRGPDGDLAPVWPGAAKGGSIKRLSEGVWTKAPTPNPGYCDVLYAQ
ncbi:MAG TPA: hypothetical protein VNO30_06770 [Kofleriaceae bacterium]|nr:hypothetical protein [Kofleriaceae bacterium]